jgi:Lar family restriction alleviation protein
MGVLKPCPFCGCAEIEEIKIHDTNEWYLKCGGCRIEQPLYRTLEKAEDSWNTRVDISSNS